MKNALWYVLQRTGTAHGGLRLLVLLMMWLSFAALGHADCPGGGGRFFRVMAPASTEIIALGADRTVTWTNSALGGTGRLQVASTLLNGGNWTHYTDVPINAWVMSQRVTMALVCGGTNSGNDPDFGAYHLEQTAFFMDPHTVTKGQWDTVRAWAATNGYTDLPVGGGKGPDHPVHSVHWYGAVKWLNARSEMEGLTPAYYESASHTLDNVYRTGNLNLDSTWVRWDAGYRLASSTEWEYAARGGLTGKRFPWGDSINHHHANYVANGNDFAYDTSPYVTDTDHPTYNDGVTPQTSPADAFAPNGYGLHGMVGNIWEWVFDWAPAFEGSRRILRGGSWSERADRCRIGFISNTPPNHTYSGIGFRAVLAPVPAP